MRKRQRLSSGRTHLQLPSASTPLQSKLQVSISFSLLNMPTTIPKAVIIEWLEQHLLPELDGALRQNFVAKLGELKQLPRPVSYYGF